MQIYVSGLPTAVGSVSFHLNTKDTIEILRRKIEIEFPFLELASYRILHHGREPPSDASVGSIGTFLDFNIPVLGGKGGFGSNLRQQGVRMQNKKTSNIESCRDLSGKRLAIVNEAQRVADYKQAEPERKKKEQAKLQKKIKEGLKEFKPQKKVVEDPEFVGKRKQVLEVIDVAVALGLKKLQQKVAKKPWSKEENSDSD